MNITKERIREWVEENTLDDKAGSENTADLIYHCMQDLSPKWVSVHDRLPIVRNEGKHSVVRVLATDGNEVCEIGFHSGSVPTDWYEWSEYGDIEPEEITHWMPLPEAPK